MLKQRVITGLALLPVAIGGVFFLPQQWFAVFVGAIILLGAWEWANLSGFSSQWQRVSYATVTGLMMYLFFGMPASFLLGVGLAWWLTALMLVISYPDSTAAWRMRFVRLLMGWLVLMPAWAGLVYLKSQDNGNELILYVFVLVWGADVGAYFSGRAFGRRKLAPHLSPGKTWEGVFGGLFLITLVALGVGWYRELALFHMLALLAVTWIVGMVSVLGDLLESMFKRERGIKDSSQLLPGHGGVMDRIDSLTAAVPVFSVFWLLAS
ncbi:phosphatidate cytidylyltransferase [Sansalvadorimonas sp. 2012CJ34-2]|uniref:Phosphatidate cytidylyltransferase n=1 Tax=Parendozoicomonas callyspongiae TaxID=2942213 RepID=A0ABT0PLY2_9GAMM|nr:phosphatidate cytidylyltransferase [Sansalvadorimonas sp. 2012CJ34-2]MCL6271991.1 phosphatidate cytidylyltransferase [Sansalvadorimonas sp. 2012CJ34-2]